MSRSAAIPKSPLACDLSSDRWYILYSIYVTRTIAASPFSRLRDVNVTDAREDLFYYAGES